MLSGHPSSSSDSAELQSERLVAAPLRMGQQRRASDGAIDVRLRGVLRGCRGIFAAWYLSTYKSLRMFFAGFAFMLFGCVTRKTSHRPWDAC